jgi:hypothetical protein
MFGVSSDISSTSKRHGCGDLHDLSAELDRSGWNVGDRYTVATIERAGRYQSGVLYLNCAFTQNVR